jgi:porin
MSANRRFFLFAGSTLIAVHAFASQPTPDSTIEPASTIQRADASQTASPSDQGLLDRETLTGDWWGQRTALEDRGVSVGFDFYGDIFQNLRGGANTADMDFMHLESLTLSLDSEKLLHYAGGTFFIDIQHIGGDNPSDNVGDWQWVSPLASDRRDEIAELWYEQLLLDDHVRIKLGKIDAAYEFDVSEVGNHFANNSSLQSPTLPGFATYPDPAFGIVGEYAPCDAFYVRGALFDGTQQEGKTLGDDGARTVFTGPSDLLLVGEIGTAWKAGCLPGRAAIGMTYHTGTFDRFDGGTEDGAAGYYFVAEQMLVKEHADDDADVQGASVFVRAGATDGDTQDAVYHFGGGIVFAGMIPSRDQDSMGFAANIVRFSDEPGADFDSDELNLEVFYQIQVTEYFSITPDLQYISNPSGDETLDDALALGLRLQLAF